MKYDYHHVSPEHEAVHNRLVNWALWADPRTASTVAPMFRLFRSKARQWHQPRLQPALDTLDAIKLERPPFDRAREFSATAICNKKKHTPATVQVIEARKRALNA